MGRRYGGGRSHRRLQHLVRFRRSTLVALAPACFHGSRAVIGWAPSTNSGLVCQCHTWESAVVLSAHGESQGLSAWLNFKSPLHVMCHSFLCYLVYRQYAERYAVYTGNTFAIGTGIVQNLMIRFGFDSISSRTMQIINWSTWSFLK